jgi:tetratricopeptide (TPR) repeat protein
MTYYSSINNNKNAVQIGLKYLQLVKDKNDFKNLSYAYQFLGSIEFKLKKYQSALNYFNESVYFSKLSNGYISTMNSIINIVIISITYQKIDLKKYISYVFKIFSYVDSEHLRVRFLSMIYQYNIKYYSNLNRNNTIIYRLYKIEKTTENFKVKINILKILILYYKLIKDFKRTHYLLKNKYKLSKKNKYTYGIASYYLDLGLLNCTMKTYNRAYRNFIKCIRISNLSNFDILSATAYSNLAFNSSVFKLDKRKIVAFLKKAISIFEINGIYTSLDICKTKLNVINKN